MKPLITILGPLATLSLIILFQILAKISEKFGGVLKMPPLYKWFYVAQGFAGLASLAHLTQASTYLTQSTGVENSPLQANALVFTFILYHIPLIISVTIGLLVTWKYWGWLITDRKK